jgi:hypothetical protein
MWQSHTMSGLQAMKEHQLCITILLSQALTRHYHEGQMPHSCAMPVATWTNVVTSLVLEPSRWTMDPVIAVIVRGPQLPLGSSQQSAPTGPEHSDTSTRCLDCCDTVSIVHPI